MNKNNNDKKRSSRFNVKPVEAKKNIDLIRVEKNHNGKRIINSNVKIEKNVDSLFRGEKIKSESVRKFLFDLKSGVEVWEGSNFNGLNIINKDLSGVRFLECCFSKIKTRKCKIKKTVFKKCSFISVDFRYSDLSDCVFENCNMEGSDLRFCDLSGVRFLNTNMTAVNLDKSDLKYAVIKDCKIRSQSLYLTNCHAVKFIDTSIVQSFFYKTNLVKSEMVNVRIRDCTLTESVFTECKIKNCILKNCESSEDGVMFLDCLISHVHIDNCEFHGAQIMRTKVQDSKISHTYFPLAFFENVEFKEVVFSECFFKDCSSIDNGLLFEKCNLKKSLIDQVDFCNAIFLDSVFTATSVVKSDLNNWVLKNTEIDQNSEIS